MDKSESVNGDVLHFLEKANLLCYKEALLEQGPLNRATVAMTFEFHTLAYNKLPMHLIKPLFGSN